LGADLRVTDDLASSNNPSLAWTGSEFGVSWEDDRDGDYEIFFARVSASGVKIGSDVQISSAPNSSLASTLAWTASEFGLGWADQTEGNYEIYFARLSPAGVKIGADLRVTNSIGNSVKPSLARNGPGLGLAWQDSREGNYEITFTRLSSTGIKMDPDLRLTNDPAESAAPSLAGTGSLIGLSWYDNRSGNYEIFSALVEMDADGDRLPDRLEPGFLTSANDWDTDGDGLSDGEELCYDNICLQYSATLDPSPLLVDTDGDGLTDYQEIKIYHTKPATADTDLDGMPDAWEIAHGLSPSPPMPPVTLTSMGSPIFWNTKTTPIPRTPTPTTTPWATSGGPGSSLHGPNP